MGHADRYVPGTWNVLCDECGFKFKATELKKRWDSAMVCPQCFEKRNPQDFVRGVKESRPLPWTRPEQPDVFVEPGDVVADEYPRSF